MHIVKILLFVLEAFVCLLLIGVILLQRSKGSGVGMSFGGGAGEAIFGAQMGNVLTKVTVILAGIFLFNTIILSLLVARSGSGGDSLMSGAERENPPAATAPMSGGFPSAESGGTEAPEQVPAPESP